jgi:Methyltransferase domain
MDPDEPTVHEPSAGEGMPFWLSACSYWQPAHFPASAWTTHAPFVFWLMDILRPKVVVELGSHRGYSSFVFAEAVRRLMFASTINALDSWEGDDHAGFYGEEVYASVLDVAVEDYPEIMRLVRGYFSDSRPLFADGSVDLLHIDGRHGYEDVREDYTTWRSAVRDGGIVLFHDIAVRDRGFGVWRLWDELSAQHPSFSFSHGYGLGVLQIGRVRVPALDRLFAADAATVAQVRADYAALGEKVADQFQMTQKVIERDAMLSSRSWALTKPLRNATRVLRSRRA